MTGRKGVATTTLVLALLGTAAVIGGVGFLVELNNLITMLISNLFYIMLAVVITGTAAFFVINDSEFENPVTPALILVSLLILGSASGVFLGESLESYTATVQVKVDQSLVGTQQPELKNLEVVSVEKRSPGIFDVTGNQKFCVAYCDNWNVNVEITCEGTSETYTQTASGKGQQTVTLSISELPEGNQCTATAKPGPEMTGQTDEVFFNTR